MLKYIVLIFVICHVHCIYYLDTNNIKWTVSNDYGNVSIPAKVPGGVYKSLMDAGLLTDGDFYYGYNDVNYRYVSYSNWTYISCFEVTEEFTKFKRISLEFEGLDTIATVNFNEKYVGSSNNMFVSYEFDVTKLIKSELINCIEIEFSSPVEWTKKAFRKQAESYPVKPDCVPMEYHGECHANHIRKMQASFAWDWGPAFPDMGIWKPWNIVGWNDARIKNILFWANPIESNLEQNIYTDWNVNVKIIFNLANENQPSYGKLTIKISDIKRLERNLTLYDYKREVVTVESFVMDKDDVELWWPNGYGKQSLYDMEVTWISSNGEMDVKHAEIGFRKIELDQNYVDPQNIHLGRHFRVKVNNLSMFLKGSNWIPAHALPSDVSDDYVIQLLEDAALSHQNCIRVWGGGVYESDVFYKTANRLGILLWQDFMFACSMYPTSDWFLRTVNEEVRSQIRRLQTHPSIFMWAANNENEAALRGNWYGTRSNYSIYKEDYIRLYIDEIWTEVLKEDESREFLTSSPTNGIESIKEGYIASNPYSGKYGDVHYYNYFADAWRPETYPMTRFASEYGFQSWPSFRTFSQVVPENEWKIDSNMMDHRQHLPFGQGELANQILTHFNFDFDKSESISHFKNYLYLSQVHQAMAIKTETEHYLRQRISIDKEGNGLTSGALYWQLNDIWQGASWSSIEYGGRWKILQNFAVKFFDPLLISPVINRKKNEVDIFIVNDNQFSLKNISIETCLRTYLHMSPLLCLCLPITEITSLSANLVVTYTLENDLNLKRLCSFTSYDPEDTCFLEISMTDAERNKMTWSNFILFGKPKDAALRTAHIEVTNYIQSTSQVCVITIETNNVALFVWLETDYDGYFIDNGFIMSKLRETVIFHARTPLFCSHLADSIEITSLTDTYWKYNRLDNLVL